MRGRKPDPGNVVPLHPSATAESEARRHEAAKRQADALRPERMPGDVAREWDRVAPMLADPTLDRLKPQFVDVVLEYCRVVVRLRDLRASMPNIGDETYMIEGRNGEQIKSRPEVAQLNETWRRWRSLVAMLGLSPADERSLAPGQGDLFDPADGYF